MVTLLVLLSAMLHAGWNAVLKTARKPEHAVLGIQVTSVLTGLVVALSVRAVAPSRATLAWCILSGILEAGYSVTLARALASAPLGPVYTIVRGGAVALVWPLSILLFGERITSLRASGTVLVVLGLASVGFSHRKRSADEARGGTRGLLVAALSAGFVGGYYLVYKAALTSGGQPESVVLASSSVSLVCLVILKRHEGRLALEALRADAPRIVAAGVLSTLAFLLFLFAMARSGAGFAVTLRNTSILFAQGIGLFLGERPKRLAVAGAVLVTLGALCLAR